MSYEIGRTIASGEGQTVSQSVLLAQRPFFITDGGQKWPITGRVLVASLSISAGLGVYTFSGSWSAFNELELEWCGSVGTATSATTSVNIYTDGGTSTILNFYITTVSAAQGYHFRIRVIDFGDTKCMSQEDTRPSGPGTVQGSFTQTANSGVINAIRFGTSATLSGHIRIWGYLA